MAQKALILIFTFMSCFANADCDWKTIKKQSDGYLYPKDCHIKVGKSLEELDLRARQVSELKSATIDLKTALKAETNRGDLWYKEAKYLERGIKVKETENTFKNILYFTLGAAIMYGATKVGK